MGAVAGTWLAVFMSKNKTSPRSEPPSAPTSAFEAYVATLCSRLGIPEDYGVQRNLPLQPECPQPVAIGKDVFERQQFLAKDAAGAWLKMQKAAMEDAIELQVVSAYRPVEYQAGIIQRKLDSGIDIVDILKVSAAPGFSEHHSGRALDLTTPGFEALEEEFERSQAFAWLRKRAPEFGFRLSYPRDNPHGVAYEPWHWYWQG